MSEITLTEFVDFVTRLGTPRITVVRNAKKRRAIGYDPTTDFWKRARDTIMRFHRKRLPKSELKNMLDGLTDPKKQTAYPEVVSGYKRFLGRKTISWFNPPKDVWEYSRLSVRVNPELGLRINGSRHVVKLYFKKPRVTKLQIQTILQLMEGVFGGSGRSHTYSLLDIRNAKLISSEGLDTSIMPLLMGEALAFQTIYESL